MHFKSMQRIVHIICGANNGVLMVTMIMVFKNHHKYNDLRFTLICINLFFRIPFFFHILRALVTKAKPLGCMTDALASATASFEVLQRQLSDCTNNVEQLQQNMTAATKTCDNGGNLPAALTTLMVRNIEMSYLVNVLLIFDLRSRLLFTNIICLTNQFPSYSITKSVSSLTNVL